MVTNIVTAMKDYEFGYDSIDKLVSEWGSDTATFPFVLFYDGGMEGFIENFLDQGSSPLTLRQGFEFLKDLHARDKFPDPQEDDGFLRLCKEQYQVDKEHVTFDFIIKTLRKAEFCLTKVGILYKCSQCKEPFPPGVMIKCEDCKEQCCVYCCGAPVYEQSHMFRKGEAQLKYGTATPCCYESEHLTSDFIIGKKRSREDDSDSDAKKKKKRKTSDKYLWLGYLNDMLVGNTRYYGKYFSRCETCGNIIHHEHMENCETHWLMYCRWCCGAPVDPKTLTDDIIEYEASFPCCK